MKKGTSRGLVGTVLLVVTLATKLWVQPWFEGIVKEKELERIYLCEAYKIGQKIDNLIPIIHKPKNVRELNDSSKRLNGLCALSEAYHSIALNPKEEIERQEDLDFLYNYEWK